MTVRPTPDPAGQHSAGLRSAAREILEAHWREPGFTCPNASTYPWLWLWDSCFHSIVWAELGEEERSLSELRCALSGQDADGFVPHLAYLDGSTVHAEFWGRPATSSITQPPIYGLTVAELRRRGIAVPDDLVESAVAGLRFLVEQRRRSPNGLIEVVHPWETGCDHSPRWDSLMADAPAGDPYDHDLWFRRKGELLETVHRSRSGAPLWNDRFPVGSTAFTAMVAYCAAELGGSVGDRALCDAADELAGFLDDRWEPDLRTWVDDGPTAAASGRIRTAEALLPLLVTRDPAVADQVVAELLDRDAFGGAHGTPQVHPDEPTHSPGSYWRGPTWPQIDYLLWRALLAAGRPEAAADLARRTVAGAVTSGFSEYWDAEDARPGGAAPQSWATLAVCML